MGITIFIAAMAGGAGSRYVSNEILLFLFAGLALSASFLMLVPVKGDSENPDIDGIVLPGMPDGSPGMPGQQTEDFVIYAIKDGKSSEFMTIGK